VHDLHRGRPGRSLHRAHIRHGRRLRALRGAQIQAISRANPQLNAPHPRSRSASEPSQVVVVGLLVLVGGVQGPGGASHCDAAAALDTGRR
jgi:hypothetical protein